jgi:hypothetical protein
MKNGFAKSIVAALFIVAAAASQAQTVDDEFNGSTLDPKWTFVDSGSDTHPPPDNASFPGTTYTLTGNEVQLTAPQGTDFYFFIDDYGCIETTAPLGDNWEVVARITNYDPTQVGFQERFCRAGLAVWQDDNHYMSSGLLSDFEGDNLGIQSFSNFNPVPNNNNAFFEDGADIFNTGPQPAYLIRIQKFNHHYESAYSIDDGVNWVNCGEIIRNAESPDGYFSNEKIRLFTTGGVLRDGIDPGTHALTPAKFDYVHVHTITPPAELPYADDEFNGPSLAPQWTLFPGLAPAFTYFDSGIFKMSGGPFSDLWINHENAAFIYQNAPQSTSYTLTMKGTPVEFTAVGYELYNGYGIWLWHDSGNWAYISNQRRQDGPGTTISNGIEYAAKHDRIFTANAINIGASPDNVDPAYLRIAMVGGLVSLQYSYDNANWTTINDGVAGTTYNIGTDDLKVRLFTKRPNGDPGSAVIEAGFDWLHSQVDTSAVGDWNLY